MRTVPGYEVYREDYELLPSGERKYLETCGMRTFTAEVYAQKEVEKLERKKPFTKTWRGKIIYHEYYYKWARIPDPNEF